MKKVIIVIVVILIALVSFSCSKDDMCDRQVTDKRKQSIGPTISVPSGTRNPGKIDYYVEINGESHKVTKDLYNSYSKGECLD